MDLYWMKIYWEVLILIVFGVVVGLFEVIQHCRQKHFPDRAHLWLVLVALGIIAHRLITQEDVRIERMSAQLVLAEGSDNRYVINLIQHDLSQLGEKLKSQEFKVTGDSAVEELLRAIEQTQNGDSIIAISYNLPWATAFSYYQQANLAARDRGVSIERLFIIPDEMSDKRDTEEAKKLSQIMQDQAAKGILVKFIKERDIPHNTDYWTHLNGMVEFRYGKNAVLVFTENRRSYQALKNNEPLQLQASWRPAAVSGWEHYFDSIKRLGPQIIHDVGKGTDNKSPLF
ncbi:MAG TPA: hypothetical protein VHA33_22860 [Candidatus Angelobacter sp.]|jgi:hypothetical protein|nr:hypothetical protein [Candidatus Angelobacter sp.]